MFKIVQQMISEIHEKTWRKELSANPPDLHEKIERAFERFYYKAPILFEDCETHITSPGTLYNYSKGGMYLEASCSPMQGSGAQIHMVNYSPNASEPENLSRYFTQVKWVKKHSAMVDSNRYGIGVKYCNNTEDLFRLFGH